MSKANTPNSYNTNKSPINFDYSSMLLEKVWSLVHCTDSEVDIDLFKRTLSNRLYTLRKRDNLSIDEISEKLNISRATYIDWERAKDVDERRNKSAEKNSDSKLPKLESIIDICNCFHVSPAYLLGDIEETSYSAGALMDMYGFTNDTVATISSSYKPLIEITENDLHDDSSLKSVLRSAYINYFISNLISDVMNDELINLLLYRYRLQTKIDLFEKEPEKDSILMYYNKYFEHNIKESSINIITTDKNDKASYIDTKANDILSEMSKKEQKETKIYFNKIKEYLDVLSGKIQADILKNDYELQRCETILIRKFCQVITTYTDDYYAFAQNRALKY